MKKFFLMAMTALAVPSLDSVAQNKVDNSPVRNFDLSLYLGKWYEIARFDHLFERGMHDAIAEYSLNPDGTVCVVNSGWKDGTFRSKEAVAKAVKATSSDPNPLPSHLRVSFFRPFYSDYRVLMVAPDYRYALVGGSSSKYLWILARDPYLDELDIEDILLEATLRGYPVHKFIWVNQDYNITEGGYPPANAAAFAE